MVPYVTLALEEMVYIRQNELSFGQLDLLAIKLLDQQMNECCGRSHYIVIRYLSLTCAVSVAVTIFVDLCRHGMIRFSGKCLPKLDRRLRALWSRPAAVDQP